MFRSKMLIDGEHVDSLSGKVDLVINPADREPVAEVSIGGREDARTALEAAKRAFPEWSQTPPNRRGEILHKAADIVRKRLEMIATFLTKEMGKPIRDSRREVAASADVLDFFAEEGKRVYGEWISSMTGRNHSIVMKQPIGVAALITPWNFPVDLLAWKAAPALAAGCTATAKPSSIAPLAATEFVSAINDAGAPPGVINIVHGPGSTVGAELVENPISRKISFTGESGTGRWIMAACAPYLKRISLELGGHAPFIVCSDASIEKAAAACVQRSFSNMGQICISVNRIYVAEDIADQFTAEVVERTRKLRIGDGMYEDVDLGPMASALQRERTREHIADAVKLGAKVLYGGREPDGEVFKKGYYFMPTVLSDVDHSMLVMRDETFGPVAPIMRFKTIYQAVALANDTQYGLAAYIYTRDLETAIHISERIEAGGIGVNVNSVADIQAPFGGWKDSGFGRELSHHGLDQYLELKHIRLGL